MGYGLHLPFCLRWFLTLRDRMKITIKSPFGRFLKFFQAWFSPFAHMKSAILRHHTHLCTIHGSINSSTCYPWKTATCNNCDCRFLMARMPVGKSPVSMCQFPTRGENSLTSSGTIRISGFPTPFVVDWKVMVAWAFCEHFVILFFCDFALVWCVLYGGERSTVFFRVFLSIFCHHLAE